MSNLLGRSALLVRYAPGRHVRLLSTPPPRPPIPPPSTPASPSPAASGGLFSRVNTFFQSSPQNAAPPSPADGPPPRGTPAKADAVELRRLFALVGPERRLMGVAMAAQLVSAGSTMLFPLALGRIVDTVQLSGGTVGDLETLAVGLAGVFTVAGLATATRVTSLSIVGGRISRSMRKNLFASVMSQDTAFFDKRQTGELANRLSSDVSAVSRTLTDNTAKLLRNAITGTTSLGMVLYLSPKLTAVALCFFPPMIGFGVLFGRIQRRLSRELVDALASANQVASERIAAVRTVRLFGAEEYEAHRYSKRVNDTFGLARKVAIADGIFSGGMFYAAQMSLLGVLYVGGGMVVDPMCDLSVGTLTSFSMYAVNLGVSVSSAGTAYGQLLKALGSSQRVFEVLDRVPLAATSTLAPADRGRYGAHPVLAKPLKEAASPPPLMESPATVYGTMGTGTGEGSSTSGSAKHEVLKAGRQRILSPGYDATVEFDGVCFDYDSSLSSEDEDGESRTDLLRGVNFNVRPGETLAIAGGSGSGKSSLMSLLSRLYLPSSGAIRLGGVDVSALDMGWLRTQIAVVPQDPILFSGTVKSNIFYAMPERVTTDKLLSAARAAGSHDMIMGLRDGYETVVGERGQGLSGGQRARVALARAFVRKPRVLVLDEATAALDSESEAAVAGAISAAASKHGLAVLVIAHRLSSLRRADRIAVLADGRITETGSFNELVARPDSYLRRMVEVGGVTSLRTSSQNQSRGDT